MSKLFQQKPAKFSKLTAVIGAGHDIYGRVALYLNLANTIMMFGVFYATVISPTPALKWITLPLFVMLTAGSLFVAAVIVWKYIIPNLIAYTNHQSYRHDNPVKKDIARLESKINKLLGAKAK